MDTHLPPAGAGTDRSLTQSRCRCSPHEASSCHKAGSRKTLLVTQSILGTAPDRWIPRRSLDILGSPPALRCLGKTGACLRLLSHTCEGLHSHSVKSYELFVIALDSSLPPCSQAQDSTETESPSRCRVCKRRGGNDIHLHMQQVQTAADVLSNTEKKASHTIQSSTVTCTVIRD